MDRQVKATIVKEFTEEFITSGIEAYEDFFAYNDLGIPLSFSVFYNLCTPTDEGYKVIDETYSNLCTLLEVNQKDTYEDYDEFIDDSNIGDE